ncbi:MAG: RnfABCDGE type electron transport complex subunit G [Mariprofundales bacterium]
MSAINNKPTLKDARRIIISLTLVAMVCTALLAAADMMTRQPIAEAQRAFLHAALLQVLPMHANNPLDDKQQYDKHLVYIAKDVDGHILAYAWEELAPDGYAGSIRLLMGVDVNGRIIAIRILEHRETPGLGDVIASNKVWLASFVNRSLKDTHWAVRKDGGDIDQFTGATISPRAVTKAVKRGLDFFASISK